MGFSLLDMLAKPAEQEGHIKRILVDKIEPSKQNFYDVSEIAELKASMRIFGDVQIAIVSPIDDSDRYRLISGHRRRLAHLELKEEGTEGFDEMLCFVRDGDPDSGDIASRLLLILSNSTARNLSDYERAQQVVELKKLLLEYKTAGNDIPGSLRKYIAEALEISETQVQRYEDIDKKLCPEIKEAFKTDEINVSVAAELATEEPERQIELYETMQRQGDVSVKAVREAKKQRYVQQCPETGKECPVYAAMTKKYMKKGCLISCVGCCKTCLTSDTCDIACELVKPLHNQQKEQTYLSYQAFHEIKCWPEYFRATAAGDKMFEYRINDRDYQVGDFLILQEYEKNTGYTGREKQTQITYVLTGPEMNLSPSMVILGIKALN